MNFGRALEHLEAGYKLTRTGWNGKNMFVYLVPGSVFEVSRAPLLGIYPAGETITYRPHVDMRYADGTCGVWLASQSDMLANDWELV